ncbi:hypothetical protein Hanom_Chr11g01052591 [Helianthus anomalus]
MSGRPRKRKRSKHGDSNFFDDLMSCNFGPDAPAGHQFRSDESFEFQKFPRKIKNRWRSLIRMGYHRLIP